jgi:membrane protease YdiL (CAAX protease family)
MNKDNSCLFYELLKFDASKPSTSFLNQIVLGIAIMIFSNMVFVVFLKMMGNGIISKVDEETKDGYDKFQDRNVSPKALLLSDILNSVIYAPITEELFFRYFLFKTIFVRYFNLNIHTANILQSLIFGGFHITNTVFTDQKKVTTLVQMLSATIAGVVQGYVYYYSNSIVPGVVSHVVNNLLATHYAYSNYSKYIKQEQTIEEK